MRDTIPSFREWKKHVLGDRSISVGPVDDFAMYQSVLSIRFWRIRLQYRPWDPFHLRFILFTNKRLRNCYKDVGKGYEYPSMIDITVGEWRNVRYDREK